MNRLKAVIGIWVTSLLGAALGCSSSDAASGSGGASASTGAGGSDAHAGTSSVGGASAGGSSVGGASSGGTGGAGGASGGAPSGISAACRTYCDCHDKNCSTQAIPGGMSCADFCSAMTADQLACRQNMCGLVPAQPNNDHCKHSVGIDQCL